MSYARRLDRSFLVGLVGIIWLLPIFQWEAAIGQEPVSSNRRTVVDAIRTIDTTSDRELESITAFLEQCIEKDSTDTLAHCALAIAQFRSQAFDAAKKSLEKASTAEATRPTRLTTGKFQLVSAINTDDAELANRLFQSLLNACQRESNSIALRKSYAEWMGEVIGVLDFDEARSPIAPEVLLKAKKSLLGIAERKLAQAFEDRYKDSHVRAEVIQQALLRFEEIGEEGIGDLVKSLNAEIEKSEASLSEALKESRDISNEMQATMKAMRLELLSIRDQIRKMDADSAKPGPGMPIPVQAPFGPPPRPIREAIYVDPFYMRLVVEYVDGRRIERYVRERREYRDIESERNSIFQTQLIQYQSLLDTYNIQMSLYSQYQKDLAAWKRSEDERRNQLAIQRRDLEKISLVTKTNLDALEGKKKDSTAIVELRSLTAEQKSKRDAYRNVLQAAKNGKPHLALRPLSIASSLITDEKNLLLRQLAEIQ